MIGTMLVSPVLAMVGLTFVVWMYMFILRIGYIAKHNVDMAPFQSPEGKTELLPKEVNYPAYNLQNLFEVPVLFYMLCVVAMMLNIQHMHLLYAAWAFVGFRVLHSMVHCTFNHVELRFATYMLSCGALLYMFYVIAKTYLGY